MHSLRRDRVLTGTALGLALMLAGGGGSIFASDHASATQSTIAESDPSELAPLNKAATQPGPPAATIAQAGNSVPLPGPTDSPPPTIRDIGDPALASLGAADRPILEKLRDLTKSKQIERIVDRKGERDAVIAFYAARNFRPLWIENGTANQRGVAAAAHLKAADVDGLDPADYPTQEFRAGADPGALAEAELRLTEAVLTYARHAQAGRVHFSRVHSDISYDLAIPEPSDVLANMAKAKNVAEALGGYNPPHAGYKALKAKLAALRAAAKDDELARIPAGPVLRLGMSDHRVPILRKRLGIPGDQTNAAYDEAVAEAVKKFQTSAGIPSNGLVGPQTVRAMNGPRRGQEAEIVIANMERWRWMPRDLGKFYSMLNIPDFSLKVVRDGATVWQTKVVVGKPSTPTPILSDTMKFITVNPTWNVPPAILNNDYLPALAEDPTVLDRMGIKVARNPDGSIRMYQPPGDRNALGRLRFNFPNKFLVYQHDTPDKYLFKRAVRAYSNGCMRVQDPVKYAEILLSVAQPKARLTEERLRKAYGDAEQDVKFSTPIPVHLTYQTAFVDDSGELVIRDDVYRYDERMLALLRGGDRRVADIAVSNPHKHGGDPGPGGPRLVSSRGNAQATGGVPSFFERLFR